MDELLEVLKAIKQNPDKHTGICGNVCDKTDTTPNRYYDYFMPRLHALIKQWPEGLESDEESNYPVEGSKTKFRCDRDDGKLWDNPRRHELLNWLIERIKNEHI